MPRKIVDCRRFPSDSNCTLSLAGEEEEVLRAATEHAVSVHKHSDSKELRERIRGSLKDEASMLGSMSRSFEKPDEVREFKSHGRLKVLNFEDGTTIGKGVFEPGWSWSSDVQPIAGGESCQAPHLGYCLKGEMEITMDDGNTFRIRAGDAFEISPGHHARVIGEETCELIDVSGYTQYAKHAETKLKAAG